MIRKAFTLCSSLLIHELGYALNNMSYDQHMGDSNLRFSTGSLHPSQLMALNKPDLSLSGDQLATAKGARLIEV